jgi:cation diffusion facilitator CzcD-associated flavoprotein CzcO
MKLGSIILAGTACALALAVPAGAQQAQPTGALLRGTNCAQFLDALDVAAAPARAGDQKVSPEEVEAASDAQDELIITLFWVHGYQSGKTGQPAMLDQQWMARTVARMTEICSASGNAELPISEAVKQL